MACGKSPQGHETQAASGGGDGAAVSLSKSAGSDAGGEAGSEPGCDAGSEGGREARARSSSRLRASRTDEASLAAASGVRSLCGGG